MKKTPLLFLSALAAFSLSGCHIDFTALTKINDDGSGFRITTYSADGASEKEELVKNYVLPGGGNWKLQEYVKGKSPEHTYEVKRTFKSLNALTPDHVRKGAKPGHISDNRFSLTVSKASFFTAYEYEETYRDSTDAKQVMELCERWYKNNLDEAVNDLTNTFPELLEKDKVTALLNERYRPYFDYCTAEFLKRGRDLAEEKNEEFKRKTDEYEARCSEEEFLPFMADYIVSRNKNVNNQEVLDKLKLSYEKYEEKATAYSEQLQKDNYDDAFGVYGIPVFMGYSFNISVVMPGKIIKANAKEIKNNAAKWEFSADDFLFKEYKLQATSIKLNYAAVGILAVALMAAVILILRKIER